MRLIRLRSADPPADPTLTLRASVAAPELRGERRLCFYAAVFDTPTTITEGGRTFTEVIRPGAFTATLKRSANVYACVEHRRSESFSDQAHGLLLQEDGRGLFASCYLADNPLGNRVLADVKSGKLRGCSFAFRTDRDRVTEKAGQLPLVEVLAADLVDVCVTTTPAYPATVVSVRSHPKGRERRLRLAKLRA